MSDDRDLHQCMVDTMRDILEEMKGIRSALERQADHIERQEEKASKLHERSIGALEKYEELMGEVVTDNTGITTVLKRKCDLSDVNDKEVRGLLADSDALKVSRKKHKGVIWK